MSRSGTSGVAAFPTCSRSLRICQVVGFSRSRCVVSKADIALVKSAEFSPPEWISILRLP